MKHSPLSNDAFSLPGFFEVGGRRPGIREYLVQLRRKKYFRVLLGKTTQTTTTTTKNTLIQTKTKKKKQPSNFWYAILIKVEVNFTYAPHSRLDSVVAVPEIWTCCWSKINLVAPQKAMRDNKYYSPDCLPVLRQLVMLVFLITRSFRSKAGIKKSWELAESKFDSRCLCRESGRIESVTRIRKEQNLSALVAMIRCLFVWLSYSG